MKEKEEENNDLDIEVIIGDDSNLNFSEAKDCVNTLRPKNKKNMTNKVIVPKRKKSKK